MSYLAGCVRRAVGHLHSLFHAHLLTGWLAGWLAKRWLAKSRGNGVEQADWPMGASLVAHLACVASSLWAQV